MFENVIIIIGSGICVYVHRVVQLYNIARIYIYNLYNIV